MLRLLRSAFARGAGARHNEAGLRLWHSGDARRAEAAFRQAASFAPACSNLGMLLFEQGRFDEALASLERAVALDGGHAGARLNLGSALHQLERVEAAAAQFRAALDIAPGDVLVQANTLRPLMDVCDWGAVDERLSRLREAAASPGEAWADAVLPFTSLLLPLDEALQQRIARRHAERIRKDVAGLAKPVRRRPRGERLRVGYVSSDFQDHATAYLCAGVFERHDRGRFEVFAYSLAPDDGRAYRRRIAAACEHFIDAAGLGPAEAAARVASDGIDLLVDMKGYTGGGRPEIFALRPAPLQLSWLGYPGTLGADFIDAFVADERSLPAASEPYYDEKVVRLPHSYQPNDGGDLPGAPPSREACGLPPQGFVFCCFNQPFKIEPVIFASWMRILAAVPESVLWLIAGNSLAEARLRDEALRRGVEARRLVFAPFLPRADHLARHRLADLFLDTHYVNAHTTGSDALRAGVPVLTWTGATFASRVATSLVHAAGLPELAVPSGADYESLAIGLARSPERLRSLRERLEGPGRSSPLFDCGRYTRDLEAAFLAMAPRA